jgi:hypothetical protein
MTWGELKPKLVHVLADKKSNATFMRLLTKAHGWLKSSPSNYTFRFEGQTGSDPTGKQDTVLMRVRLVEDDLSAPDIVIVFGLIVAPTEDGTTYLFINPETAQLRPWITTPVSIEPLARSSITPFRDEQPVTPVIDSWIEMVEKWKTFSLKGLEQLLLPAFDDDEGRVSAFVGSIKEKIQHPQDIAVVESHAPRFRLDLHGLAFGSLPNGRANTLNITYTSWLPEANPKKCKLVLSVMLERPEVGDGEMSIVPGSMMVLSEIEYLPKVAVVGLQGALHDPTASEPAAPRDNVQRKFEMSLEVYEWSEVQGLAGYLSRFIANAEAELRLVWDKLTHLTGHLHAGSGTAKMTLHVFGEVAHESSKSFMQVELKYTDEACACGSATPATLDVALRHAWTSEASPATN